MSLINISILLVTNQVENWLAVVVNQVFHDGLFAAGVLERAAATPAAAHVVRVQRRLPPASRRARVEPPVPHRCPTRSHHGPAEGGRLVLRHRPEARTQQVRYPH